MSLIEIYQQYLNNGNGEGPLLIHKKGHDGKDFICLRGLLSGCESALNCDRIFTKEDGCYCLADGQVALGKILEEEKHRRLIDKGAPGAYRSLQEISAMC